MKVLEILISESDNSQEKCRKERTKIKGFSLERHNFIYLNVTTKSATKFICSAYWLRNDHHFKELFNFLSVTTNWIISFCATIKINILCYKNVQNNASLGPPESDPQNWAATLTTVKSYSVHSIHEPSLRFWASGIGSNPWDRAIFQCLLSLRLQKYNTLGWTTGGCYMFP